jgi:hypothetical protein
MDVYRTDVREAPDMTTPQIIERVIEGVISIAFWGYAIYSVVVGFRYGFKFPRPLHWIAIFLLALGLAVLVIFSIDVRCLSALLATTLICLPVSPYVAWAMSGGPVRCRGERMKQRIAEQGGGHVR